MEAFLAWAEQEYAGVLDQRGLLRTALGYAVRQKAPLMRVLEDGRLVLENNRSERAPAHRRRTKGMDVRRR
jgi:hypothetical protein